MRRNILGLLAIGLLAGPLAAQAVTIDFDRVGALIAFVAEWNPFVDADGARCSARVIEK